MYCMLFLDIYAGRAKQRRGVFRRTSMPSHGEPPPRAGTMHDISGGLALATPTANLAGSPMTPLDSCARPLGPSPSLPTRYQVHAYSCELAIPRLSTPLSPLVLSRTLVPVHQIRAQRWLANTSVTRYPRLPTPPGLTPKVSHR